MEPYRRTPAAAEPVLKVVVPARASPAPASSVAQAFAPIHKRALGVAIGVVAAFAVFAVTAFHVVFRPADALQIGLLSEYFYGYAVSWRGALVGAFWGFFTGFVAGWFAAFVRNFVGAVTAFVLRAKGELLSTRDFLDQI